MTIDAPDLLDRVGRALYGTAYQTELSRTLDVRRDTVRRWLSGREAVPPGVWVELASALAERRETLIGLASEVSIVRWRQGTLPKGPILDDEGRPYE